MGVYTNTMRYTGTSGVDVESMVQALMKAEGMKSDRLYREKQKLEWTQQMFRDMGTSVKSFSNNYLSFSSTSTIANMRSTAAYSNKSVSGKFSGGETISTGSSKNTLNLGGNSSIGTTSATAAGDYEINVKSVATGDSYQSKAMGAEVVSTKFPDLDDGDYLTLTVNGNTQTISFTGDEVDDIYRYLDDKGMSHTRTEADRNQMFKETLQTKIDDAFGAVTKTNADGTTRTEHKVIVDFNDKGNMVMKANTDIGTTLTINPPKGLSNLNTVTSVTSLMKGETDGGDAISEDGITFSVSGKDTYLINGKEIEVGYEAGVTSKDDYIKDLNTKLKDVGAIASLDSDGKVVFKKTKDGTENDISVSVTRTGPDGKPMWSQSDDGKWDTAFMRGVSKNNDSLYTELGLTATSNSSTFNVNQKVPEESIGTQTLKIGGQDYSFDITADMTYKDVMNKVNATGKASLTFNANTNGFTLQSKVLGENGKIEFGDDSFLAKQMQLGVAGATHKGPTNAEVHVKGPNGIDQTLIRETNTFTYADINFKLDPNLQSKIDAAGTGGLKIEMSVTTDTSKSYDNIKGFIDSYNKLIDQLSSATTTTRAKAGDYSYFEPLTEAEKEGMTDAQIEKLENKAKQGMLYRNPELTRLHDKLREITTTQVTMEDGSKMSLAKIGITTGDYTQGGKLFIDEDKLRAALENNPDGVAKLFTDSKNGVAEKMYNSINDAVGSNGYITKKVGFTDSIYSKNNYYSKQIEQKSKELDRVNDYLIGKENYYYRMFANMEKVITESNNQMASLMNY